MMFSSQRFKEFYPSGPDAADGSRCPVLIMISNERLSGIALAKPEKRNSGSKDTV